MPRIFINLEAGCRQVNLMSTSAQINQLKYTILYYTSVITICSSIQDIKLLNRNANRKIFLSIL